jgi:hypothetical protein
MGVHHYDYPTEPLYGERRRAFDDAPPAAGTL